MTDVIEKMAREIAASGVMPFDEMNEVSREAYRVDARAALAAALEDMMEPSAQTKLVGARSIGQTMDFPNHTERSKDCWQAMLDQYEREALGHD